MRFRFESCVLDTETRELTRDGVEVHLPRKAFDLLSYLICRRPSAVGKDELHDRLWNGTEVGDASLANLVSSLRRSVGDSADEPRIIRTVHGFGYAFSAETVEIEAKPGSSAASGCSLVLLGREFPLRAGENLIGRGQGVVVAIEDVSVSRRHARIRVGPQGVELEDLSSKNGTRRNGEWVRSVVALDDLDEIQVGDVPLIFRRSSTLVSTRTGLEHRRS